jgi:hypothetical protein
MQSSEYLKKQERSPVYREGLDLSIDAASDSGSDRLAVGLRVYLAVCWRLFR